jgi:hypothetical protein
MSHRATGSEGAPGPDLARTGGMSHERQHEPQKIVGDLLCGGRQLYGTSNEIEV